MSRLANPVALVILNEVKNLVPRVFVWGSVEARVYARDEILHFVQNDKDVGAAFPYFPIFRQPLGHWFWSLTPNR
jgi:hypothetical protein